MRIGKRDVTHQPVRRHRPILAWRPRWRTLNQGKRINRIGRRNPIRHPAGANPTIACCVQRQSRVARWFVFKPKIKIWIKFRGPWRGKCCHILWPFGIFYCHLVYFIAVWCSLWSFGIYFPFWYVCTKKNLATLRQSFEKTHNQFTFPPNLSSTHTHRCVQSTYVQQIWVLNLSGWRRPKCSPIHSKWKFLRICYRGKSSPTGEYSPNLVNLVPLDIQW
jgi:hypothetical protein